MLQVALLRGINLGPARRVPMADLRARLKEAGYADVRTYLQSGNLILSSELEPADLAQALSDQLAGWFRFEIPVLVRSAAEFEDIVAANPLGAIAENPKYHVVTFLDRPPAAAALDRVAATATDGEQLVLRGREIYTWHPRGQARSKLASALTDAKLGVLATARNFSTVTALRELIAG